MPQFKLPKIKMIKCHTILPGTLFQRGHMLKHTLEEKHDLVLKYNIRVVIGLACEKDPHFSQILGEHYLWHKISDGKTVDDNVPILVEQALQFQMVDDSAILCYCRAGRNRSGLLNALLLCELTGCSGREAIHKVRVGRKNAIANEAFVKYIEQKPGLL